MRIFKITAFLLLIGSLAAPPLLAQEEVRLGMARVEMTPAAGTPLAGYGKRHGKGSEGVHDLLYARAVSLQKGNQVFVFVSCDLVLIDSRLRKAVLQKIRKQKVLPDENFVLAATHTHSGAGAIGGRFWERFIMGKFRKPVFEKITRGIAEAALASLEKTTPVSAEYGEARIDSLLENRMDEKLSNPILKVLRFKTRDGKTTAHFILMAAHPTILPAKNFEFSADFPGVLNQILEEQNPGSVSLFLNGAAGDLRPRAQGHEKDRFQKMASYGQAMASEISKIQFSETNFDGPWKAVFKKVTLPAVKARAGRVRFPSLIGGRVFPRHSYFQAVRTGPFLFLAFPAELSSETGLEIEKLTLARKLNPLVIGYANDYIGYVVPERYYRDSRQYESRASFYGPKLDWFVQKQTLVLMDFLSFPHDFSEVASLRGRRESDSRLKHSGMTGNLPVLKLEGDPYHLGFEEGRLLKKDIHEGIDDIFRYFRKEFPVPIVNRVGINFLLDRAWKKMEPYVSYSEFLQMKGVADGAGISFKKIRRLHALPEVYPAFCTNGAYWGKATADGRLIAIRNLDWNRQMGVQRRAAVKFIRQPGRKSYVNIGYAGFTGVLSGMNEKGISVGQIGAPSAEESLAGVPMPFLLKRILEDSQSLEDAAAVFKRSDLTRGYNYVIADATARKAIAVEATRHHLAFFQDQDPAESHVSYAFPIENAVFRADPAVDPAIRSLQWASEGNPNKPGIDPPLGSAYEIRYKKQAELVRQFYGKITPEAALQIARELAPGSNIQSVVYAFPKFWVANAEGDKKAAESGYTEFSFMSLRGGRRPTKQSGS